MSEKMRIVVIMQDGVVTSVLGAGDIEVALIDYDVPHDTDDAEIVQIPQTNGSTEPAIGHIFYGERDAAIESSVFDMLRRL